MLSIRHQAWRAIACALCALAYTTRLSGAGWVEEYAEFPFVLRADTALANAPAILTQLHELQADLTETLGVLPPQDWIEIYLFRDQAAFCKYVARQFPGNESRRALFIQGRGPAMVLVFRSDALAIDLRHETTHALLDAHTTQLPLWLDEGLAEYFEESPERRVAGHPHLAAVRAGISTRDWPSLEALERQAKLEPLELRDYQAAWAWAHYLINGPSPLQVQLRAFLAEAADGPSQRTLADRLRELDPNIERAMLLHWQALPPKAAQLR